MELGTRILSPALQRQAATAHYHQLVAEGKVVQTGKKRPSPAPLTAEGQESLPSPALQTKKDRRERCSFATILVRLGNPNPNGFSPADLVAAKASPVQIYPLRPQRGPGGVPLAHGLSCKV